LEEMALKELKNTNVAFTLFHVYLIFEDSSKGDGNLQKMSRYNNKNSRQYFFYAKSNKIVPKNTIYLIPRINKNMKHLYNIQKNSYTLLI